MWGKENNRGRERKTGGERGWVERGWGGKGGKGNELSKVRGARGGRELVKRG